MARPDLAYQERATGNTAIFIFALSVLFAFLVLAAQYESWSPPLAIILIAQALGVVVSNSLLNAATPSPTQAEIRNLHSPTTRGPRVPA